VKIAKGLTEEQKKEFIIKDNVGFGEWDWDVLANEWDSVSLEEWGLDVPEMYAVEEQSKEEEFKAGLDKDYSKLELILYIDYKNQFLELLNDIKIKYSFDTQEEAIVHIINNYKI
jgi:hypothetical protein